MENEQRNDEPAATPPGSGSAPGSASQRDSARGSKRVPAPLAVLIAVVAALHGFVIAMEPVPTLFEDEPHYAEFAFIDAAADDTSLVPGSFRFAQRPELISRLWSRFVQPSDLEALERSDVPSALSLEERVRWVRLRDHGAVLQRRARWVNLGLLLVLLLLTHAQARALGLGPRASVAAAALVGLFPWFGFYVHTLWAETLHASLLGAVFLGVLKHLADGRCKRLVPAGIALGIALLTKGTMNAFLPVIAVVILAAGLLRHRDRAPARRIGVALLPSAILVLAALAIVAPQLATNAKNGHGLRIAGNRWKNLEMGVVLEPRERQTLEQRADRARLHQLYMQAGDTYETREALAEERTRAYVAERGLMSVGSEQLRKLRLLLFSTPSFFERALTERWGDPPPVWLAVLRRPGRVLWCALLLLGVAGAVLFAKRSPAFFLLALFVAYFGAAAFVIPYKMRFLMPLVPTLCLLTAATVEHALRLHHRRRSPA